MKPLQWLLHPKSISTAVHILEMILDIKLSYSLNIIVRIKYLKPKNTFNISNLANITQLSLTYLNNAHKMYLSRKLGNSRTQK